VKPFRRVVEGPVTVDALFDLLSSERWPELLAEHLGDGSQLVRRDVGVDGGVTLVMSRMLPAGVPGFLKRFVPADPRVVTTDEWSPLVDGRRRCRWTADIVGTPAKLTGTQLIEPTSEGNRHVVEGEVRVSVPLVGGKAEAYIAEQGGKLADLEADVVRKVLGR
jgi:hypothetical protein